MIFNLTQARMHGALALTVAATLAAVALATATAASAQDYPSKPITIVSAQASGGASDTIVRAVAGAAASRARPAHRDGEPAGASGNVGAAQSPAPRPTVTRCWSAPTRCMTSNVHLFKSMPFDPVKDFAPITNAGANIIVMAVHADVPAKSVAELVAYAKANPGKVQFGVSGVCLAASSCRRDVEAEDRHRHRPRALSRRRAVGERPGRRPYPDGVLSYSSAAPLIPTGKIRVLAVVEKTRYAAIAGRADGRRDRSRIRDVILARLLCAGRRRQGRSSRGCTTRS